MKKLLLVLFFFAFATTASQAQIEDVLSRTSLEAGWGYSQPTSLTGNASGSDYAGLDSYYAGAHYSFAELWGGRLTYAYNRFKLKDAETYSLSLHKIMLESTFNVSRAITQQGQEPFEVLLHTGLGISIGKSFDNTASTDAMGSFQIGLMPKYYITDGISMHLDASYIVNFSQDYGFDGGFAKADGSRGSGSYFLVNLGLAFKMN